MQLIYEVHNQYVFDTDELENLNVEDLKQLSEEEIINAMTDEIYSGTYDNLHSKIITELINDNNDSERYFEKDIE